MSRRKERKAMRQAALPRVNEKRVATGRQIRFGRAFGLLVCAAGFAAMGLGWFGTARVSCTDCQIPYLLSGGAVGLGLVIFGVTILVVAQLRAEGRRTADRLERLEARLAEAMVVPREAPTPAALTSLPEQPPPVTGNGVPEPTALTPPPSPG